jgi:putative membrane protein
VALFLTAQVLDGVVVNGGLTTYLIASIILSLLFIIVKPILTIITLPLNIISLGIFSYFINAVILYLLTVFVPSVSISAFQFKGLILWGFVVPEMSINGFFAFILASIILSLVLGFIRWLTEK